VTQHSLRTDEVGVEIGDDQIVGRPEIGVGNAVDRGRAGYGVQVAARLERPRIGPAAAGDPKGVAAGAMELPVA